MAWWCCDSYLHECLATGTVGVYKARHVHHQRHVGLNTGQAQHSHEDANHILLALVVLGDALDANECSLGVLAATESSVCWV